MHLVTIGCGGRTTENNTYFTSQGASGSIPVLNEDCTATICKCDPSICQLRLDFLTFNLAGRTKLFIIKFYPSILVFMQKVVNRKFISMI